MTGTPTQKQPQERSEYVRTDAQDAVLSSEVIEPDTSVPAQDQDGALSPEVIDALTGPPGGIQPVTPLPVQDQDVALSPEAIDALTAVTAPTKVIEPVTPLPSRGQGLAVSPELTKAFTRNERSTARSQIETPVAKPPVDHRALQSKAVVPPHPSVVGEPSAVRKVDGQYAVWNHGSAQGVRVGDEVKLVRGAELIGRGQVIAVRTNDCDLEIAETYAVASVAVGDRVKLSTRAITP